MLLENRFEGKSQIVLLVLSWLQFKSVVRMYDISGRQHTEAEGRVSDTDRRRLQTDDDRRRQSGERTSSICESPENA